MPQTWINLISLVLQACTWIGALIGLYWLVRRNETAKRLDAENNYLKVMKEVNEEKAIIDHASLDELVNFDNERSSGGNKKR